MALTKPKSVSILRFEEQDGAEGTGRGGYFSI